ncbi:MAG: type II secretion system protein [Gammaproteobacteria bacterium]|nr:type II secretion system protein [Gammaproteobacteria bacterium]
MSKAKRQFRSTHVTHWSKCALNHSAGFSLIELVVFIVVIGLAVSGIFLAFSTALQKAPLVNTQTLANQLAIARMDMIIGQRRMVGFSSFTDICPGPAVCTVPAAITGYTITSTITPVTIGSDTNYKLIDVTVTGPQNSKANLKTWVASWG